MFISLFSLVNPFEAHVTVFKVCTFALVIQCMCLCIEGLGNTNAKMASVTITTGNTFSFRCCKCLLKDISSMKKDLNGVC